MNIIKLCSLFLMLILSTGLITTKNDNIPLSKEELKYIFPDDNFRKVVCDHFPHEDITLSGWRILCKQRKYQRPYRNI